MNEILLTKIAQDLMLFQFSSENSKQYSARVVYSGMALWLKTITLDNFESNPNITHSISKHHHFKRAEQVLNQILDFFPELKPWFFEKHASGDEDHPIHVLRERLMKSEDIIEVNYSNYISLSADRQVRINNKLIRHTGIGLGTGVQYSGISALSEAFTENFESHTQILDCLNFTESYIKQIKFSQDEWTVEKEYFNPTIKTDTFHYGWTNRAPDCGIYISRIVSNKGNPRYFFEKKVNGKMMSHKIDDFIIQSGNYQRFLLALRHNYNNPLKVTVERHCDHFKLKRFVKGFPYPEESIIQSYGWPIESLQDTLNWVFQDCLYDEIIEILENLLIKIEVV